MTLPTASALAPASAPVALDPQPGPLDETSMVVFELLVVGLALAAAALLSMAR